MGGYDMGAEQRRERYLHNLMAVIGDFFGGYAILNRCDILGSAQTANLLSMTLKLLGGPAGGADPPRRGCPLRLRHRPVDPGAGVPGPGPAALQHCLHCGCIYAAGGPARGDGSCAGPLPHFLCHGAAVVCLQGVREICQLHHLLHQQLQADHPRGDKVLHHQAAGGTGAGQIFRVDAVLVPPGGDAVLSGAPETGGPERMARPAVAGGGGRAGPPAARG